MSFQIVEYHIAGTNLGLYLLLTIYLENGRKKQLVSGSRQINVEFIVYVFSK